MTVLNRNRAIIRIIKELDYINGKSQHLPGHRWLMEAKYWLKLVLEGKENK